MYSEEQKIKVIIFGSNGLVGTSLTSVLSQDEKFTVIPSNRATVDLFNFEKTKDFISSNNPDVIINAAAKVGGIFANNNQRVEFILENLKINMNILESCIDNNKIKIINLGSSCIYPVNANNPIKEDYIMSGSLEPTNSPYAMAKLSAIEIGNALNLQYGHNVINLMPTNLYGPYDNFHPVNSHVIPGLINRIHIAKEQNSNNVEIWGDGSPLREFLYVDDLSKAIKFILLNEINNNLINVGSSSEVSILELAKKIVEVVNYSGNLIFDKTKPNGNNRKLLDSSLIFSYGWVPETNLEMGLKKTYNWYLENISYLRN